MVRPPAVVVALVLLAALLAGAGLLAQPPAPAGTGDLLLALRKLLVVGNVLYVAAHPDDENTAMLAYLSRGRLVRAGYLAMTRGDGGQNLIGPETGERMGVLRTQELLAARRVDRAEQLFTRAVDFGYSKSPEETLSIWGKEAVLSDVVRAYRAFRPDVVVTRFPTNGDGGHGHHTASAILAGEAFAASGDPSRFPEQLTPAGGGLTPWKPRRLFWNAWRVKPEERDPKLPRLLTVDLGAFNPFLGRSYAEIAAESRTFHKSQGFGAAERRGTVPNYLELVAGDAPGADFLEGVDLTWGRVPGSASLRATLEEAVRSFRPERPHEVVPVLLKAHRQVAALDASPWVDAKRRELEEVIRAASGIWVEAIAAVPSANPGGEVKVTATALCRSPLDVSLERLDLPFAVAPGPAPAKLVQNEPLKHEAVLALPETLEETHPYWLVEPPSRGLFTVEDPRRVGLAENPDALVASFTLTVGGERLLLTSPVRYRWTDPVQGERYRPLEVLPKLTLHLEDRVSLFRDASPREVRVVARAGRKGVSGSVRLSVPDGWTASAPQQVSFGEEGEEKVLSFRVTPPAGPSAGSARAEATVEGRTFSHDLVRVDYPHVPVQTLTPPAEVRLVRADVATRGGSVGYVAGPGDEVPEALRQMGYRVTLLTDEDLEGDLSGYDAVVTGVRAYNTRPRLKALQERLLDYVAAGGTLVVQYSTSQDLVTDRLGPYPLKLSRERVTVEEAPVTLLLPEHPLSTRPNRITPADFDGWVQERGLYFPGTWDPRYEAPFATSDPGEPARPGGLLFARHGKGAFVYTGYAFFRQLPAGVPGAYRLFANLVSAGASR